MGLPQLTTTRRTLRWGICAAADAAAAISATAAAAAAAAISVATSATSIGAATLIVVASFEDCGELLLRAESQALLE